MPMTQVESAALMSDPAFKGRVKVCCIKYADSILIEASNVPAHNTRVAWAKRALTMPDQVAFEIQPPTVMDAAVQESGAEITDALLQASVEVTVNKIL